MMHNLQMDSILKLLGMKNVHSWLTTEQSTRKERWERKTTTYSAYGFFEKWQLYTQWCVLASPRATTIFQHVVLHQDESNATGGVTIAIS